jgi:uncharacterized surface protein with fasciclin (FAS1) repeats
MQAMPQAEAAARYGGLMSGAGTRGHSRFVGGGSPLMRILFTAITASSAGQAISEDLSQAISLDERTTLFANAVVKAELNDMLTEPGPFIVFIPSDKAMTDEGSAFLLNGVLLTESNAGRLADLVRHHVVRASDQTVKLSSDLELQTLANVPLDVARVGTGIVVGRHAVVTGRLIADNGIAYIVDRLLWPRESN